LVTVAVGKIAKRQAYQPACLACLQFLRRRLFYGVAIKLNGIRELSGSLQVVHGLSMSSECPDKID
jgi:hypothetical protein